MGGINYINNGKSFVYKRSDLFLVYDLLKNFYVEALKPLYGECDSCEFEYDRELNTIRINRYKKDKKYIKGKKVISLSECSDVSKKASILLDSISATGVVSSPCYYIKISFVTNIGHVICMNPNSLLVSKGGTFKNKGYYSVVGKIM